jgi:uncharacterized protein YndB with AHSA1/START domain
MNTDRIEKSVFLRAPRARVWRALSDVQEFGDWFGVILDGPFTPGARLHGKVTHKGYENYPFEITIDRVEGQRLLSWRWVPQATDPNKDYSGEPTTLVVFELQDVGGGTRVNITESGFEALPADRRAAALEENEKGWTMQTEAISQHLAQAA